MGMGIDGGDGHGIPSPAVLRFPTALGAINDDLTDCLVFPCRTCRHHHGINTADRCG